MGKIGVDILSQQPAKVSYMKASPGQELDITAGPSGMGWGG